MPGPICTPHTGRETVHGDHADPSKGLCHSLDLPTDSLMIRNKNLLDPLAPLLLREILITGDYDPVTDFGYQSQLLKGSIEIDHETGKSCQNQRRIKYICERSRQRFAPQIDRDMLLQSLGRQSKLLQTSGDGVAGVVADDDQRCATAAVNNLVG